MFGGALQIHRVRDKLCQIDVGTLIVHNTVRRSTPWSNQRCLLASFQSLNQKDFLTGTSQGVRDTAATSVQFGLVAWAMDAIFFVWFKISCFSLLPHPHAQVMGKRGSSNRAWAHFSQRPIYGSTQPFHIPQSQSTQVLFILLRSHLVVQYT